MSDVADDEVWLTVESHKGIGGMYTYCGLGSRDELDRWRRGELRGAITLKRTYWVEEDTETGRRVPIVVGRHTSFRHGTGTVYLAAETIVLVMEMHHPDPGVLDGEEAQVVRLGAVRESRQE